MPVWRKHQGRELLLRLSLGSWLGGKLADRVRGPLLGAYAVLERALGAVAILVTIFLSTCPAGRPGWRRSSASRRSSAARSYANNGLQGRWCMATLDHLPTLLHPETRSALTGCIRTADKVTRAIWLEHGATFDNRC